MLTHSEKRFLICAGKRFLAVSGVDIFIVSHPLTAIAFVEKENADNFLHLRVNHNFIDETWEVIEYEFFWREVESPYKMLCPRCDKEIDNIVDGCEVEQPSSAACDHEISILDLPDDPNFPTEDQLNSD